MLQNDFEIKTISFFYSGKKDFEEIQQIFTFIKATNLAKQIIQAITNLDMMAKKKLLEKYSKRSKTNKECFNSKK